MSKRQRYLSVERLEGLAKRAIADGSHLRQWRDSGKARRLVEWNIAMQCQAPIPVELHARHSAWHNKPVAPLTVVLSVRCRKCDWCKKMRERLWTGKAVSEWGLHPRSWFLTLTMSPQDHFEADARVSVRLAKQGVDFDLLTQREKFEARAQELGKLVTLYIKRLRKGNKQLDRGPAKFRYLIVAEAHKGRGTANDLMGRPHFHMLMHESSPGSLVRDAETRRSRKDGRLYVWDHGFIRTQWPHGHSKVVLAEDRKAAAYVCKYISKASLARVRASHAYGEGPRLAITERSSIELVENEVSNLVGN